MRETLALNLTEAETLESIFERLFPVDSVHPGAAAIGAARYADLALAAAYREHLQTYRFGLAALNRACRSATGVPFKQAAAADQDRVLGRFEKGDLSRYFPVPQQEFLELMRLHCLEGLFSDPVYGGNPDKLGWRVLGNPGVW